MSRPFRSGVRIVSAGCLVASLGGCVGTGVFLDHTFTWFGNNPNSPAGNSENFAKVRGLNVDLPPLMPENGNVWPGPQKPDPTLDELQKQQAEDVRKATQGQGQNPGASGGQNPAVARGNAATRGLPPPQTPPAAPRMPPTIDTPNGPALDVTGGGRSYRGIQSPVPGNSGILVPNGNGTSTLIGPDGSVKTVPTRP